MLPLASGTDVTKYLFAITKHSTAIRIQGLITEASDRGALKNAITGSKILDMIECETKKSILLFYKRLVNAETLLTASNENIFHFYIQNEIVEIVRVSNALRGCPDDITPVRLSAMQARLTELADQLGDKSRRPCNYVIYWSGRTKANWSSLIVRLLAKSLTGFGRRVKNFLILHHEDKA